MHFTQIIKKQAKFKLQVHIPKNKYSLFRMQTIQIKKAIKIINFKKSNINLKIAGIKII